MRAQIFALFLLSLTPACGDGSGTGSSDGSGGSGTGAPNTGGSQSGGDPSATKDDHEAACRSFCDSFTAHCGFSCPETCDGYANTYGEECAAQGVDFFNCMAAEGPTAISCDAGIMKTITDGCVPEQDDLTACFSVGGVFCERETDDDTACATAHPSAPFAFYCVSEAVPDDCSQLENSYYCCPSE